MFRTPAPPLPNEVKKEELRNEATVKAKPTISHAEMTSLDVLVDNADPLDLGPEYMPPRAKGYRFNLSSRSVTKLTPNRHA